MVSHTESQSLLRPYRTMLLAMLEISAWLAAAIILPGKMDMALYALAAVLALAGTPFRALQMLTVQFLLAHFNSPLIGWSDPGGIHLITPVALLAKVLVNREQRRFFLEDQTLALLLFVVAPLFLVFQGLFSSYPALSVCKAALFFIYVSLVLFLTKWCFLKQRAKVLQWYLGAVVFLIVASLGMWATPYAYFRNGAGFNGVLLHPNALGMILGIGLSYLLIRMWVANRIRWAFVLLSVFGLVEIYLSQSRGGLFTCLLSVGVYLGWRSVLSENVALRIFQRSAIVGVAAVLLVFVNLDKVQEAASGFLVKARGTEASFGDAFESSRGAAIDLHLELFKAKPWTGHGFQVVNAWTETGFDQFDGVGAGLIDERLIRYDPIIGKIPVSAPVESGFMYTSILAENGIVGGVLASGVLLLVFVPIFIGPKPPEFVLAVAALLANLTEATIFSTSGIGGWVWMSIALAYAAATVQQPMAQAGTAVRPRARQAGSKPRRASRPQTVF